MNRGAYAGLCLLVPLSVLAQPECPSNPPPYALLRQDQDYRYLGNPACRQDHWDRLKYVPLGADRDRFVTFGGEIREWYEGFHNAAWGLGPQDGNGYLLQRLTTYADVHASTRIRFFVQLTSDTEYGRNGGPRPVIDQSKLFFEQAFVDMALSKAPKSKVVLRAGRQELELGSGRLVNVREGPNVRRTFDGVSLEWKTPSWSIEGLAAKPVLNGTGFFDAPPDHGSTFWGVYAVHPFSQIKGGNIDLYYLGLDRKDAVFETDSGQELRHTAGARFWGERNGWSYDSEAAFQWGSLGAKNIRAWGTGHDASYTFRSIRLQPQIGTTALVASGNRGNSKSDFGTLNPLFPTGFYFGQGGIGLFGPSNLMAIGPNIRLRLAKSLTVIADNNIFWRTSLQDGIYSLGVTLLVSGQGNSERYVGSQPSVGIYWKTSRHLSVSVAYGHFFAGSFLVKAAPPGRDVDYAGVWTTYKF
jgi:hypothetical protein